MARHVRLCVVWAGGESAAGSRAGACRVLRSRRPHLAPQVGAAAALWGVGAWRLRRVSGRGSARRSRTHGSMWRRSGPSEAARVAGDYRITHNPDVLCHDLASLVEARGVREEVAGDGMVQEGLDLGGCGGGGDRSYRADRSLHRRAPGAVRPRQRLARRRRDHIGVAHLAAGGVDLGVGHRSQQSSTSSSTRVALPAAGEGAGDEQGEAAQKIELLNEGGAGAKGRGGRQARGRAVCWVCRTCAATLAPSAPQDAASQGRQPRRRCAAQAQSAQLHLYTPYSWCRSLPAQLGAGAAAQHPRARRVTRRSQPKARPGVGA